MAIVVIPTDGFTKELKRISKKHPGILSDIAKLSSKLKETPKWVLTWGKMFTRSG